MRGAIDRHQRTSSQSRHAGSGQASEKETPMSAYKRILVPTDGTKLSLKAAKEAASLAKDMHAEITAVYVMAPWTPPLAIEGAPLPADAFDEGAYLQSTRALAGEALEQVSAAAAAAHVKCDK